MYQNKFSVKHNLREIFLQRYSRYLPTAFDESDSLLEKMNKVIDGLNSVVDVVNAHTEHTSEQLERAFNIIDENLKRQLQEFADELSEQATLYEEIRDKLHSDLLPDAVRQKLEEWELDGTIKSLLNDGVMVEHRERIEELENRMEEKELLEEVSINDYADYAVEDSDGVMNWTNALTEALKHSLNIVIPEGKFRLDPISLTNEHSDLNITGRGNATKIEVVNGNDLFKIAGEKEDYRRVSQAYEKGSYDVYLDDTSGLKSGDDILIQSQKNCLNYEDAGDDWLLGSGTGDDPQRVPFGEFAQIQSVHSDRITLTSTLIYPFYDSHAGNEKRKALDFSRVSKVNFAKNITIKDITVEKVRTGFALRTSYAKNVVGDGIIFIDNEDTTSSRGVCNIVASYGCEVRNSAYRSPNDLDFNDSNYWNQNPFKIVSSHNCGFFNCTGENTGQMVDLSFFGGYMPCTSCYIKDCRSINASRSAFTTHGGNYLTVFTGNYSEGSTQGFSHRGRGGLISGNVLIGSSNHEENRLRSGVSLYQGGACDNVIEGNVFKRFSNGVSYSDGGDHATGGRARVLSTIISNNFIDDCRYGVMVFRYHTGDVVETDMELSIINNHFRIKNAHDNSSVRAIYINERNKGITVRGNTFKGIESETTGRDGNRKNNFYAVYAMPNVDNLKVIDNEFVDIDKGVYHSGTYQPYDEGVYPDGVDFYERDNIYTRVRTNNTYRTGVNHLSNIAMEAAVTESDSLTTTFKDLRYFGSTGIDLRNPENLGEISIERGLWHMDWNFHVRDNTSDGVTIEVRHNGIVKHRRIVTDSSHQNISLSFRSGGSSKLEIFAKLNSSGSSANFAGGVGENTFSIVKLSD